MAGTGAALQRANSALAKSQALSSGLASGAIGADGATHVASNDTTGGALWTNIGGFISALLGGQVSPSLPSRSQMVTHKVPAAVTTLQTCGFAAPGDGGNATYARATGPFSDGASFQSADGAWWKFAPGASINAAQFGVVADGYSFNNGKINAGALSTLVLATNAAAATATTVGNPITIIGGAGTRSDGSPISLITTIVAVSGNTITLGSPVSAAMASVCGNFGTDNTVAIGRIMAYAWSLISSATTATIKATDVRVMWPYGITCFSGTISIPDYVSIEGCGSRGSQWLAMAAAANVVLVNSGYNGAGSSYGQNLSKFSIHGNNITTSTSGLVHASTTTGASFNDFRVWWSLGDGLNMDNAQNCQFNNCTFAQNGNPGASFYTFTVAGLTVTPANNAVYTNNAQTFYVASASIASGSGTILCVGTGAPASSGILANNNGGTGDAAITFSAVAGGGAKGAQVRFTNSASGNVFIRCEMPGTANYCIVFEGGCGSNTFINGECETYKGQYVTEYYPSAIPNSLQPAICNVLADGGAGATPYQYDWNRMIAHQSAYAWDTGGRVIPHVIQRNGGTMVFDNVDYQGDGNGGIQNTVLVQYGPNNINASAKNYTVIQGAPLLQNNSTLFYDAGDAAGKVSVDILGELDGVYTALYNPGTTGQIAENVVRTPVNVTLSVNSGQIRFPATQNPSSNANTLDDYEEGAAKIALAVGGSSSGITYSSGPNFNYVKVGRIVHFSGRMTVSSLGGLTGALTITGLPFIATTQESYLGAITFPYYGSVSLGSGYQLAGEITGGSSVITINLAGSVGTSAATHAIYTSGMQIAFSGTYLAAA